MAYDIGLFGQDFLLREFRRIRNQWSPLETGHIDDVLGAFFQRELKLDGPVVRAFNACRVRGGIQWKEFPIRSRRNILVVDRNRHVPKLTRRHNPHVRNCRFEFLKCGLCNSVLLSSAAPSGIVGRKKAPVALCSSNPHPQLALGACQVQQRGRTRREFVRTLERIVSLLPVTLSRFANPLTKEAARNRGATRALSLHQIRPRGEQNHHREEVGGDTHAQIVSKTTRRFYLVSSPHASSSWLRSRDRRTWCV